MAALMAVHVSCANSRGTSRARPDAPPAGARVEPDVLQSLHVRLAVRPSDGSVEYLGWYDGRRNLLGSEGIVAGLVGIPPGELRGKLSRVADNELLFEGVDENQIGWVKRYRLDDLTVHVTYRVTNGRDQAFDAIVYSLASLPDATMSGDNRDQYVQTPDVDAHFHAEIENPHFPGEQMNPSAMRSDARRLEPGESMEFKMTWELAPKRRN
jgi:hypothetical protein